MSQNENAEQMAIDSALCKAAGARRKAASRTLLASRVFAPRPPAVPNTSVMVVQAGTATLVGLDP